MDLKNENDLTKYEGYFMYMADAAVFTPCGGEKPIRVSMEKEYIKVEKKYLQMVDGGTWVYLVLWESCKICRMKKVLQFLLFVIYEVIDCNAEKRCK
ncbi:MAG: hypothetical protein IPG79_21070 [Saprospiraceae bacterium]|nr:hypothetical protein [Saprospiraceae bacterium]